MDRTAGSGRGSTQFTDPYELIAAPIVETFLLGQINLQSLITTNAGRVATAAAGKSVIGSKAEPPPRAS